MAKDTGLDALIGETRCQLIQMQDKNTPILREIPYYHHQHLYYEFHYTQKGVAHFLCQGQPMELKEKQLMIIPPGIYHSITDQSPDIIHISLSVATTPPKYDTNETANHFLQLLPKQVMILSEIPTSLQEDLYRFSLLSGASPSLYLRHEKIRATTNLFLLDLYEILMTQSDTTHTSKENLPPSQDFVLDTFFSTQFISHSSSKDLAESLHISPRQLHRLIQKKYAMNFREKSKETRIEIATNLLLNSDMSISQISELLGYSKSANFSYFIKQVTGKTPSQIRKEKEQ